jgi:conjugative relaxase-like TrwC/TraI family protein
MAFSAPKSVSLMALVGRDERLLAAFEASVKATLGWVERNLIEARRFDEKSGTQQPVTTGNMIAGLFTHDLSRNRDPQLHIHAVIANATQRPDGAWRALRNDPLYAQQATIAAAHNADLRARIEALGYRTTPAHNPAYGQFEITGISREHIMAFSTRREEIAAALEASGRGGTAAERELAALSTRAAKDPGISREEDRAAWAERAASIGFDPAPLREAAMAQMARGGTIWDRVVDGIKGIAARGQAIVAAMGLAPHEKDPLVPEGPGRLSPQDYAAAQAVASGVRHLSQNEAGFSRFDLIRASLSFGGPMQVADIEARIDSLAGRRILLTDPDEAMMTTRGAVALEREVIALWARGRIKPSRWSKNSPRRRCSRWRARWGCAASRQAGGSGQFDSGGQGSRDRRAGRGGRGQVDHASAGHADCGRTGAAGDGFGGWGGDCPQAGRGSGRAVQFGSRVPWAPSSLAQCGCPDRLAGQVAYRTQRCGHHFG